jgi:hypothetical protein
MEGNMRIEVDLKFRCKGCGLPVEVEMEYNPTMEEMPPKEGVDGE